MIIYQMRSSAQSIRSLQNTDRGMSEVIKASSYIYNLSRYLVIRF